jgi:hypothetical protein
MIPRFIRLPGNHPFKLGLFRMNCAGGPAITKAPERWKAEWDDIVAVAQMADDAGFEMILPLARWRGYGGQIDNAAWSFETMTQGAALAALTRNAAIFVTVHVPLVHPVFAAKAVATIDHVSHGRVGLNIVCRWNQDEFGMFGMNMLDHEARYDQGYEWFEIFSRLILEAGQSAGEAQSRLNATSRLRPYSITSSARPITGSGTLMPSALAALRLIISSTFVACWIGRSAGLAPFCPIAFMLGYDHRCARACVPFSRQQRRLRQRSRTHPLLAAAHGYASARRPPLS